MIDPRLHANVPALTAQWSRVILGKPVEKRYEPPRPGDIRDSWADIGAARETLGYGPSVDLAAGLELTAEAILARV